MERVCKKDMFICPGQERHISYGPGYGGWAAQTNQKAMTSYAMVGIYGNDKASIETTLKML